VNYPFKEPSVEWKGSIDVKGSWWNFRCQNEWAIAFLLLEQKNY